MELRNTMINEVRELDIIKSSRHQKIIGDFGENLVCNWLSRSGFEVALVDHTGIDVIAFKEGVGRLGISIKSRTRLRKTESSSVNLFKKTVTTDDRVKIVQACNAFACEPWIGVYVETELGADLYLTSIDTYDKKYCTSNQSVDDWKMSTTFKDKYDQDTEVKHIHIDFKSISWAW